MKKIIFITNLLIILALSLNSFAQENLIISKETRNAINKKTRQKNGEPGKKYWQNTSDYFIKASVDAKKGILTGEEKIVYHNNSPDSLKTIVIRLYQDIFKKGANRLAISKVDPRDINNGVNISRVAVNKTEFNLSDKKSQIKRRGTLMLIRLNEKLAPKKNIELEIKWDFNIPKYTLLRMGTFDSTSFFLGQWYPQIAVYDDIRGWDTRSYNGMAEFYNDFANFDVEITVPDNFMVWATGTPQNLEEVLQPEFYNKYKKASASDDIINVITEKDLDKSNIRTTNNVWKYKASKVTDFAFSLSNHYVWDVTSVIVDKKTNRRTIVGVAYKNDSENFDKVAYISKETIKSLSENMPGIPYPFPYLTVFNGDFGMEYPMMTNVGTYPDYNTTVYANSHEITHGYFPFYVATNETRHGWLDEGLVVFMPEKIQKKLEPTLDIAKSYTKSFSDYSGTENEPAVITPTYYLDGKIYFYLNYCKTEEALRMLEMHLGEELFKNCLQEFINRWKYKHPSPFDFFFTFNDVSKQNLNWFWEKWYFQHGGYPDLAITYVRKNNNILDITISNKGNIPIPVEISLFNNDKLIKTISKPASVWKNNKKEINVSFKTTEKITNIKLGNEIIPDSNSKDNNKYIIN
ncbi:MAG: M1 family metallopeptidase [Bacteroidales bacterium]|nr:M1 family metallopeptidase [Bacteroidales bacterium]